MFTDEVKPSGSYTNNTKPSGSFTNDSKPSGSFTNDTKPSGSFSNDSKPSGTYTNEYIPRNVEFDSLTQSNLGTFSHTVPSGTRPYLLLAVCMYNITDVPTSVTYGGDTMTVIANEQIFTIFGVNFRVQLYGLANPDPGANNVVIVGGSGFVNFAVTYNFVGSAPQPSVTDITVDGGFVMSVSATSTIPNSGDVVIVLGMAAASSITLINTVGGLIQRSPGTGITNAAGCYFGDNLTPHIAGSTFTSTLDSSGIGTPMGIIQIALSM